MKSFSPKDGSDEPPRVRDVRRGAAAHPAEARGRELNHKKLLRLYREDRLTVRCHGGQGALATRDAYACPQGENERWSPDFVSDVPFTAAASASSPLSTTSQRVPPAACASSSGEGRVRPAQQDIARVVAIDGLLKSDSK
jgi:hypothetical protein